MKNIKKTALYDIHKKLGAKMIDFAGYQMPVSYEGIIEEHEAVRNYAGLFDVSHMGEIEVIGPQAQDFLQSIMTNDIAKLENNHVLYTLMCNESGGILDDLMIYRLGTSHFYLVVNASNVKEDFEWIVKNLRGYYAEVKNISSEVSQLALQGPKAEDILQVLTDTDLSAMGFLELKCDVYIDNIKCMISRTGYTGEDGFELYVDNEDIVNLWDKILKAGKDKGIKPIGLGARDTLRFEAGLPLYGNEINEDIIPFEAGLGAFVKLDKKNFIGKEALAKQHIDGIKRKIIGFEMQKGISRHGYSIYKVKEKIGEVTTGYFSPTLKKSIGFGLIDIKYANIGTEIEIEIRNKMHNAVIVNKRFYKKNYKNRRVTS